MYGAKAARGLLLAVGTVLAPVRLGGAQPARADVPPPAAAPHAEADAPDRILLAQPDPLAAALRVEFGASLPPPVLGFGGVPLELAPPPDEGALLTLRHAPASAVAEPPRAVLLALMLAGAMGASRGRRRCPRWRPRR